jgi:ubiquinone/menaquinone biosynthesis C-methylase UbiE
MAKERFGLFKVPGRFEVANAEERIPFPDNSFDHVYSFGVIHHSPVPERIVREINRVLRKDGTFTLRFALPDGKQVIPVEATSNDGVDHRAITPIVTRKTV